MPLFADTRTYHILIFVLWEVSVYTADVSARKNIFLLALLPVANLHVHLPLLEEQFVWASPAVLALGPNIFTDINKNFCVSAIKHFLSKILPPKLVWILLSPLYSRHRMKILSSPWFAFCVVPGYDCLQSCPDRWTGFWKPGLKLQKPWQWRCALLRPGGWVPAFLTSALVLTSSEVPGPPRDPHFGCLGTE